MKFLHHFEHRSKLFCDKMINNQFLRKNYCKYFESKLKNKLLISCMLFIVTMIIFGWNWRYVGSGDLIPNELLPISIINERDFDFNEFINEEENSYWFKNIDGKIVSNYPVIPGLLNLPVYLVAHVMGKNLIRNRIFLSLISSLIISSLSVIFKRTRADENACIPYGLSLVSGLRAG